LLSRQADHASYYLRPLHPIVTLIKAFLHHVVGSA
jgi:hypothetical protein